MTSHRCGAEVQSAERGIGGAPVSPEDHFMFINVNGQLLNTAVFGTGPRTLVAHGGWVGNWEMWQQPFELLSPRWRCIGYDHRGAGESTVRPADITPDALVRDLFSVLDAFGVERCVLAGESLGAVVVLEAARRQPERFDGLVLVDGGPAVVEDRVRRMIDGARQDYPATIAWFVDACVPEPDSEHIRRWGRHILARADAEAAARMFECYLDDPQPMPPLAEIRVPALVIHGTADAIVPAAVGEWVAGQLPDAKLVLLEGAGHVPTMTRPHQVVDAIESRFGQ
jgi:pimeloyl-ACP methyl ester carboxylesterase